MLAICSLQLKTAWKSELSNKNRCFFLLLVIICIPQVIFNINAVVLVVIIC